jgi:hypothetical protein
VTSPRLRSWLALPFTALVFLIHPIVALSRPVSVFQDPGIGWHLVTGRWILETRALPREDFFSFTALGRPWITYSWLFEAGGAALEHVGGLPLFAAACVLVYALIPVLVFRRCLRLGAGLFPALFATVLAYMILASHALARPHIFTYLFFALTLERLSDVQEGRAGVASLAWLPLIAVVWCNVHSGFPAGLTIVGIFAAVAGVRGVVRRDPDEGRRARAFALALAAMLLATFVNPNGWWLHAEIVRHLGMATTRYFSEFQSPDFHPSDVSIFAFELTILLVVGIVGLVGRRLPWVEVVLLVFFLHEGLESVRHMNLFAIVAAPIIAREVSRPLARRFPRLDARSREIVAEQAALRAPLVYFPALSAVFLLLALVRALPFPSTLIGIQLTRGAADFIAERQGDFRRAFNTDDLGGSLIYRFWPDLRVFVDDRIGIYGDDFIMNEYFKVLYAKPGWRDVLDRYHLTAAVVSKETVTTELLRASPSWKVAYEDDKNVIFLRGEAPP